MGLYPEGLSNNLEQLLMRCQRQAEKLPVDQLIRQAEAHYEKALVMRDQNANVDVDTAESILDAFKTLFREWDAVPEIARPWCKGMMRYFVLDDDEENDFLSPIGFDDDAEVVNACLRFAGREDLVIDVKAAGGGEVPAPKPKRKPAATGKSTLTSGMRVRCREAEWLITRVDPICHDPLSHKVHCVGCDDLVRGHEAIFLTRLDEITPVDPLQTGLMADTSNGYQLSKLFIGARLRQLPATGVEPDFRGLGVFRPMKFQEETVRAALRQLRPRLLLADAVGLGKTIQVGMILTELLRRGRANRILVLAKKSMLTQFQAELWNRFAIPLVRLDSAGIAKLRLKIPANKNPFEVYHRVIISIDTLKNVGRYEHFLKDTHWDVVVIDEAHNVAGASVPEKNQSYRLARQLARRTNSILLTTATPHNGRRETFGRLVSLLDPSVIPDPDFREYGKEDIRDFVLMRFKEDVREDAGDLLTDRRVIPTAHTTVPALPEEEAVYAILGELRSRARTEAGPVGWGRHPMVQYVLYKLFLSSPEACAETVEKRIRDLEKSDPDSPEMPWLSRLGKSLKKLDITRTSRYRLLVRELREIGWTGRSDSPRVLIFTETPRTQRALAPALADAFQFEFSDRFEAQPRQTLAVISGATPDIHLMKAVEAFGTTSAPVRLMLATDVASEGINLHHACHHIIHYDLPWSIITLIQRNGRIDRLGQKHVPELRYLMVETAQAALKGDGAIFERLITKVEEINRLRRSGESVLQLYDPDAEEAYIARKGILAGDADVLEAPASEISSEAAALEAMLREMGMTGGDDAMAPDDAAPSADPNPEHSLSSPRPERLRFFSDRDFLVKGYTFLRERTPEYPPLEDHTAFIALSAPADLKRRLGAPGEGGDVVFGATAIPLEAWPENGVFRLTPDPERVNLAIQAARNTSGYWAEELLISEVHPILQWVTERIVMQVPWDKAPYVASDRLAPEELCFCFIGQVSSVAGAPLIIDAHAVSFAKGGVVRRMPLDDALAHAGFGDIDNTGEAPNLDAASLLLHSAVAESLARMTRLRNEWETDNKPLLQAEERRLRAWRNRRRELLEGAIEKLGPNHPKARRYRNMLTEMDEYLTDRERNWRDTHFRAAREPSTQLLLVIGGKS